MTPDRLVCFPNAKTPDAYPEGFCPEAYMPPADLWQGTKGDYAKWQGSSNTTDACLMSMWEGVRPATRISKDNAPARWLGMALDYDHGPALHDSKVEEYIDNAKVEGFEPTYWHRSKSGGVRLVWLFAEAANVNSWTPKFCERACGRLAQVVGAHGFSFGQLDATSFRPTQRFDAGAEWHKVGDPLPVSVPVGCAQEIASKKDIGRDIEDLPWSQIEKNYLECREEKGWAEWTTEFREGAVGPPFWDTAIESKGGRSVSMYANGVYLWHGTGTFIPWSDERLFGNARTRSATRGVMAEATEGLVYASGESSGRYYLQDAFGQFEHVTPARVGQVLRVRGLSTERNGNPASQIDEAMEWIAGHSSCKYRVELSGYKSGILQLPSYRYPLLNTVKHHPVDPAPGHSGVWGDGFPLISGLLERLFSAPYPYGGPAGMGCEQLTYFMLWCAHVYRSAYEQTPGNRYAVFLCGSVASGKTVFSEMFAKMLGGTPADAEGWLYGETSFNKNLFASPLLLLDDPVVRPRKFQTLLQNIKQTVAASSLRMEAKGIDAIDVPNTATLMVLTNDTDGTRLVPCGDSTVLDKICAFRTFSKERPNFKWPEGSATGVAAALEPEIPHFAAFLLSLERPDWVPDGRYCGFAAYQNSYVMEQAASAPGVDELLSAICGFAETVTEWEDRNGKIPHDLQIWEGTSKEMCDALGAHLGDTPSQDLEFLLKSPSKLTYKLADLETAGFVSGRGVNRHRSKIWRVEHKCLTQL